MRRFKFLAVLALGMALAVSLTAGAVIAQGATVKLSTKVDKKHGTAVVTAKVSTKGNLKLTGKGIKSVKKTANKAGKVKLKVKATGKTKKALKKKGKAKVKATVKFSPKNGTPFIPGTPAQPGPYNPYNPYNPYDPYTPAVPDVPATPNDKQVKKNVTIKLKKKHHN